MKQQMSLMELKNKAMGFDRAEMRDVHIVKDAEDYLSRRHMGVWNIDRNELACLAPKSYCVIQHRHAVESVVDAITSLNIPAMAELKAAKHGIFVDISFPEAKFELKEVGDKFTAGIQITNRYDQVAGLVISPKVTRLACSNGMVVTEIVRQQRIRYTEELKITVEGLVDKMIKDIISSDDKLANMVSSCMADSIEWQALRLLTKGLFRKKKHIAMILGRLGAAKERFTRWDFYNAVTNYATHGERIKPQLEAFLQKKAAEIMKTPFDKLAESLVMVGGDEEMD